MVADSSEPLTSPSPAPGADTPATITVPAMPVKCMPQMARAMITAAIALCLAVRRVTVSHSAVVAAATATTTDRANRPGR